LGRRPSRAVSESTRATAVTHCWASSFWPAGMKTSSGRSTVTRWPSRKPSTLTKDTTR
jgi:hypothetical protein